MARKKKKKPWIIALIIFLVIFVVLPLIFIISSLFGRISPGSVIPDSYSLYMRVPNPAHLAGEALGHESLPEILSNPVFAAALPAIKGLEESGLLQKKWFRFIAAGALEGALLPGEKIPPGAPQFLAAWDSRFLSPLLRFLPALAGRVTVPGLYYVQAGKNSRFEYRNAGEPLFFGPYHNLLIVSNNPQIFESVINGHSRDGDARGSGEKPVQALEYDAALLLAPELLSEFFAALDSNKETAIEAALKKFDFSSPLALTLSVASRRLDVRITGKVLSQNPPLKRLLEQVPSSPSLTGLLPAAAQYSTILSAGTLHELYNTATVFSGPELAVSVKKADASSRAVLGLSLDDLLFSWPGKEFAVFGLEGRQNPIYAIEIADEQKRSQAFEKAFKSAAVEENIRLNLDGMRIPRIEVPAFLHSILELWGFRVPSPYYTIHSGYLFLCESAETLQAAVRSIQKNEVLPKTAIWKELSKSGPASARRDPFDSDNSSFSLYYSLDRSLPFFLKGNTLAGAVFGLYRQGLLRLNIEDGAVFVSLSVIPGSGKGLVPMPGYPLASGGALGNKVYGAVYAKAPANRIFITRDNSAISINPQDNSFREFEVGSPLWIIPAEPAPKSPDEGAAWVVSVQGRVTLVNGNMESMRGFPLITGLRLSSPPAAWGGKLYLCDEDGKVYVISLRGETVSWETEFPAALRSPPSFLDIPKSRSGAGGRWAAVYPKSFLGEIWLLDADGRPLPGWPAPVSGIAFGSPLIFTHNDRVLTAFVTQAGVLSVHDQSAAPLPPFPLEIEGVFYVQPVFDGSSLWLISAGGDLYQVSLDGTVLSQNIPNFSAREDGYLTAFDVDGDKIPEIFFSGEGNTFYGYTGNFHSLEGFPLPVWGRPSLADLNGDGKIEIVGAGLDNQLYRWQFR
ncbi:MAG: hypothetical protein LBN21_01075 [Treponema sp.]|jgi:outer membrane protein assembly factor BamB|nr:hypothetical protein [Treponema sp.]